MRKNRIAVTCSLIGFFCFIILFAENAFGDAALSPYISTDKIYALHKPADWKATDTIGPDFYRVKVTSPDGASLVDFYWARNLSGNLEAESALLLYMNTLPAVMGQWSSVVMGIWGPRTDFVRYVPLLEQVANSYAINDAFARSYIQSGLANLRRLQQKTAAAIQSLNDARADNQAAWEARQERKDYMDSKWDDYRRGNSYWVSDIEGGKVYRTDSSGTRDMATGDYYEGSGYSWTNFEGRNPLHPSEDMNELSSYEVEHSGKPN